MKPNDALNTTDPIEANNAASAGCMARLVRHALQQVLDYRQGKGRFNLSHLNFCERDNAAHDLWQEVEDDIRQAIEIIETNISCPSKTNNITYQAQKPSSGL